MVLLIQALVNGLILGLSWALVALGLSLLFGVMGIVNFAHGSIYMLGAVGAYFLISKAGLNYLVSLFLCIGAGALLGPLLERLLFRPLLKELLSVVIMGISVSAIIDHGVFLVFGTYDQTVPSVVSGILKMGGVSLSLERIVLGVIALFLIFVLLFFIYRTRLGLLIRAVTQDKEAASLMGIEWSKVGPIAFAIAFALATAAGGLFAPLYAINPFMGHPLLLKGFIIVTLGGLGSLFGSIVVAIALGIAESILVSLIGYPGYLLGFILVFVVLLVRPQGLFGHA